MLIKGMMGLGDNIYMHSTITISIDQSYQHSKVNRKSYILKALP